MSGIHDRLKDLAQPVRVRLLRVLELEELGVGELAKVVQLPQSTVSRHLEVLHQGGWVDRRRDGPSTLFAASQDLPPEARSLWEVVRTGTDGDHPEDGLRLASVIAARQESSEAFFGRVAGRWSELRRELFGDGFLLPALLGLLPPDHVIVDAGCGPGDALVQLAPHVARVIGIDREKQMLDTARARCAGFDHVELRRGDVLDPPIVDGEADAILCMLLLHHLDSPADAVAALGKGLAPGGRLVVVDMVAHDRDAYRRTMGHRHLGFEPRQVETMAKAAGLAVRQHRVLAPDPEATGPALFVAVLGRA